MAIEFAITRCFDQKPDLRGQEEEKYKILFVKLSILTLNVA
ncbi:MAG: hypothetical protein QM296_11170 [Bacillota bacterium]|nr:hypothetical protein [Bacillota bacterium]